MSELKVSVIDQVLKTTEAPVIASGGINEVKVIFTFCEKWDGFIKTALFYRDTENVYYAVLDDNDTCILPWEVCVEDGTFYFSVIGDKEDARRTSTIVRYKVGKGIIAEEMIPSEPTQDVYNQMIAIVNENKAATEAFIADMEEKVESDYFKGDKGEKGDKGDKGDGLGITTAEGGAVFNDYDTNQAKALHATAFGIGSKANGQAAIATGVKGLRATDESGNSVYTDESDWRYNEAIGTGSMASGSGAVAYSKLSKSLGLRTQTGYPPSKEEVNKRPEVVTQKDENGNVAYPEDYVGQAAVAIGADTASLGNHSFAGGFKSKSHEHCSFTFGRRNESQQVNAIAMGEGLVATGENQAVFGQYNAINAALRFIVGVGTSDENRKNALEIWKDTGKARFHGPFHVNNELSFNSVDSTSAFALAGMLNKVKARKPYTTYNNRDKGDFIGQLWLHIENTVLQGVYMFIGSGYADGKDTSLSTYNWIRIY